MDFRILGPLEVLDKGRVVSLGGSRQRVLLTLLLLHVNETISMERLVDELWGERPPDTADRTVYVQISRLRKALGRRPEGEGRVVTHERGYRLTLDRERIDAHRFERLVAEGGRELAAGRPERAADTLERALALWRGAALHDAAYEPFAQSEIKRLHELRVAALEQRIDADLALGSHADVAGRLPALIADHPYREHLRAQLMLALYRCDRQADALQAFRDARRELVDELGIEPGERLRALERAILAQDPALLPPGREPRPAVELSVPRADARDAKPVSGRRLVTVVVAGSSGLAERLDPESLHAIVTRRSAVCADVLDRHGGTVERFAGDGVVGIFGLRSLHEDDALRAVRAALELRDACAALGAELEHHRDVRVPVTLGISSGEVFVGAGDDGGAFPTGDAMSVATRLDEAAGDREILLGEQTYRLVAPYVDAEPLEPLAVRGRDAEVRAFKLLDLRSGEPLPLASAAGPFIARQVELDTLREQFARAETERACRLVAVFGPPGIGKSRLLREFVADVSREATAVVGRCLSYGDGVTYRPLAEIVEQLAGTDPERGIAELLTDVDESGLITRRVLGALGLGDEPAQAIETFWAVRRLFEVVARRRPLMVVIDDAHWAEPTLLDLIEYLEAFSSEAPILLVCLARRELLESRPAWGEAQPGRSLLQLDALSDADARALIDTLAPSDLRPRAAARILDMAEGNPLFLEQLVAVRAQEDIVSLPLSIEALLAARIERLEPDERAVLAHASVEGRSFHHGAVAAVMPQDAQPAIARSLMALVRKQLIRPDRAQFAGEDAFRFAHALIREVAYSGLPRRLRADLHERLADWLKDKPRVPDEILGYHLEQVYRHRVEIGAATDHDRAIAAEAADRLATAARAALTRGDAAAGALLLESAVALLRPEDPGRTELLCDLGAALVETGRLGDADRALSEAIERAAREHDPRLESRALVDQQLMRIHAGTAGGHEHARRVADAALGHFEQYGDDLGRCRTWRLQAWIDWIECMTGRADDAWQCAATYARRAGDDRELFEILGWRASASVFGPTPVPEAIRRCDEIRQEVRTSPVAVALILHPLALLHAMTGDFDVARRLIREGHDIVDELGRLESAVSHYEAVVEMLAGRPDEAEMRLRPGYEALERMGEQSLRATTAAMLAQAVYAQGRADEADVLCRVSERIAAPEDVVTQVVWRGVRARILARGGRAEEGEILAREAVRLAEPTDQLVMQADALLDLADVVDRGGRPAQAGAAVRRAVELYERKGDLASAARARARLGAAKDARVRVR
jgi:DNA-binding SARP family transcriptional activator